MNSPDFPVLQTIATFLAEANGRYFPTVQTNSLNTLDVGGRYSENPTLQMIKPSCQYAFSFRQFWAAELG
jgi:hypothetical protein